MTINETITGLRAKITKHHRYRSWEHCFRYFNSAGRETICRERERAARELMIYLASWGMYRASSFLLQHDYTIHLYVIDQIALSKFSALWNSELQTEGGYDDFIPLILEAAACIRNAYEPFTTAVGARQATDTLVSKVILGTFGCLPVCDRFFIAGFKSFGNSYSQLNSEFMNACCSSAKTTGGSFARSENGLKRSTN